MCHAFVFPSVPEAEEENIVTKFSDDEDSGNDEPEENKSDNREQSDNELDAEDEFAVVQRPDPPAPRNLNILLELLAEEPEVKDSGDEMKDVCALPVEVLLTIFSHLDDISLCSVGQTCKQWKKILEVHTTQHMWKRYTRERWPLFQQISTIPNWLHVSGVLNPFKSGTNLTFAFPDVFSVDEFLFLSHLPHPDGSQGPTAPSE